MPRFENAAPAAATVPGARPAAPAQPLAKRSRETPDTPDACTRELEDELRMNRLAQARELFQRCREKFPDQIWNARLREMLQTP